MGLTLKCTLVDCWNKLNEIVEKTTGNKLKHFSDEDYEEDCATKVLVADRKYEAELPARSSYNISVIW